MKSRFQRGFTLIELMIVVAIVGILAAVAMPLYEDYAIRSQVTEGLGMASEAKSAVSEFRSSRGRMPSTNASAGLPVATSLIGNYVASITVSNGGITVRFGNKANANISGQDAGLSAYAATGTATAPLAWVCGRATAPTGTSLMGSVGTTSANMLDKYLPSACRP